MKNRGEGGTLPYGLLCLCAELVCLTFFELVRNYQLGVRTTVMDLSILTQRAGLFSCGATSRNGPCLTPSGAPSIVSATITSESRIPESSSASEKMTQYPSAASARR